jgi:hypothetical protein
MSRKTTAQKAKAVTTAPTPKDATKATAKHTSNNSTNEQPRSKKIKLTHEKNSGPAKPLDHDAIAEPEPTQDLEDASLRKPGHPRTPPPAPPNSIPIGTAILPPEADDAKIRAQFDLHFVGIAGSSKMEAKIQQALTALRSTPAEGKHVLVALTAPSRASNKCVGITEMVKREFIKDGNSKLFQYTGCWTRLEAQAPRSRTTQQGHQGGEEDGEEDGDAFEAADVAERQQLRNATCFVVYLSPAPIARLRDKYGEQEHSTTGA